MDNQELLNWYYRIQGELSYFGTTEVSFLPYPGKPKLRLRRHLEHVEQSRVHRHCSRLVGWVLIALTTVIIAVINTGIRLHLATIGLARWPILHPFDFIRPFVLDSKMEVQMQWLKAMNLAEILVLSESWILQLVRFLNVNLRSVTSVAFLLRLDHYLSQRLQLKLMA